MAIRNGLETRVVGPLLKLGGRLLDHLPERIRPAIRHRDRGDSSLPTGSGQAGS